MISYLAVMAYIVALCNIALFLIFGSRILKILFNVFMAVGVFINIGEFFLRWYGTGQIPTSTLSDFTTLLSIAFVATYFVIYAKYGRPLIGLFIAPFPVIFSAASAMLPASQPYHLVDSAWRYGHLPFIVLGTTFFVASFLSAVMYFIQEKQLKGKKFGVVFQRFPPLDAIYKINDTTLRLGFYFFTIGVVLGFAWMVEGNFENLLASGKVISSVITWLVFAVIIGVKIRRGLSPRRMAALTILGFLSVLVTYIGVAVFLVR